MFLRSVLILLLLITLMQGAAQKFKTEVASGKFPTSQNKRLQKELDSLFSSFNHSTPDAFSSISRNKPKSELEYIYPLPGSTEGAG